MQRISNNAASSQILRYMFATQSRLNDYQRQVVSEKISPDYAGIAQGSQFLVDMENARASIGAFMTSNETADFRLQIMETATDGIGATLTEFMNTLKNKNLGQNSTEADILDVQRWAFDSLSSLESHLNTQADGRYIYSGTRVTTQAVEFNLTNLDDFQQTYNGSSVTYPTTREMHTSDFSLSSDTNNQLGLNIDAGNWLTFRQDGDGIALSGGDGIIEATSAMFTNAVVGSSITITDSVSNNGTYTIKSVSADGTQVTVNSHMLTDERLLTQLGTDETIPTALTTEAAVPTATITLQDTTTVLPALTGGLAFDNATGRITATNPGTLGGLFVPGDIITVSGTTSNNATYVVDSVDGTNDFLTVRSSATTIDINDGSQLNNADFGNLTFDQAAGTITAATLGAFSAVTNGSVIDLSNTFGNDGLATVHSVSADGTELTLRFNDAINLSYNGGDTAITGFGALDFDRANNTLTSSTADFSNMVAGDVLIVDNSAENDGKWAVSSVSADGKTLTFDATKLTDEGLNSGTKFFDYTTGSKSVFSAATNSIQAQTNGGAALAGAFSDLQQGDTLTVAGSTVAPSLHTKVVFTDNAANLDTIQLVADDGTTPIPGAFSDISVGDTITATGSFANNGAYVVNWVSEDGSTVRVNGDLAGVGTSTDANSIALTGATFTNVNTQSHLAFADGGVTDRITMQDDLNAAIPNAFDNMTVGMTVTIANAPNAANNGTFLITAVNAAGGFIDVEAYPGGGDPALVNATVSDFDTTITASGNDGTYTVDAVSADGSTVTFSGSTPLIANQTDADGTNYTTAGYDMTTGTKLYIDAAADTVKVLQKGTGATVTNAFDNLRVGQTLNVLGTAGNNAALTVGGLAAGVLTTNEDILSSESDPLASLMVYAAAGTAASNSYYEGDNVSSKLRLDNNRSFDIDVNALDPAFEKAIRAMGVIAQGKFGTEGGLDQNLERVSDAIYLLHSALRSGVGGTPPYGEEETSNINELGIRTGFKRVLIQETTTFHRQYTVLADDRIAMRENVDMLEAITHMMDETNALEAAYEAVARIQGLSLSSYM